MADLTPYSTVEPMFPDSLTTFLHELDAQRVAAYTVYESIYWTKPDTFRLVQRGSNSAPIYVPSGRVIVDTTSRFTGTRLGWNVIEAASDSEALDLSLAFTSLFRRERFLSRYAANKHDGIMRGDWAWHVVANPNKLPGSRISLLPIDPGSLVKHFDPNDPDRVIGIDIVDQVVVDGEPRLQVQRYQKGVWQHPIQYEQTATFLTPESIYSIRMLWKPDDYAAQTQGEDTTKKPLEVSNSVQLPPDITALPVYHIPHNEHAGDPWGSSEMRGLERVMAAVNQGISDEELALALEGLGVYATDAGPPKDDNGNTVPWRLGPGRVVELERDSEKPYTFERVNGIGTVRPYMDHLGFLVDSLYEATGSTAAARGKVDVEVAESGIALQLQMAPMLNRVELYDQTIVDVTRQMWFDLRSWFGVYEPQFGVGPRMLAVLDPVLGDKLPVNVDKVIERVIKLYAAQLVDAAWAHAELEKAGLDMTGIDINNLLAEQQARAAANDPFAERMERELAAGDQEAVVGV